MFPVREEGFLLGVENQGSANDEATVAGGLVVGVAFADLGVAGGSPNVTVGPEPGRRIGQLNLAVMRASRSRC